MASIVKSWGVPSVEYQTNAYGGVDADVSVEAVLAEINFESSEVHGVSLKFKVNSSGTTDNFVVRLYTSDDGSEWDTVVAQAFVITATGGDDVIQTFLMPAPAPYLRVSGIRSGSTDTFDVELTVTTFTFAVA